MALKIRMARAGAKKRPYYHIVVTDERNPRDGKYIERLGSHDPFLDRENPSRVVLKLDRVKHWLSVGAQVSDRIHLFLANAGILEKKPLTPQTKKNKPKRKAMERVQADIDRKAAAEQAAKDAAEAEAAAAAQAAAEPVVEESVAEEIAPEEASVEAETVEESASEEVPAEESVVPEETTPESVETPAEEENKE
ncbi:MAG: 30S ribosomal protein S16 [Alphaproteobacteria bacterium]